MKNNKSIKMVLMSIIALSLCGVLSVFAGYRHLLNKTENIESSVKSGTTMAMQSIRQTAVKNGITQWSLDAAAANYLESENRAVFEKPSITFFLEDNSKASLIAHSGIVKTDSKDVNVSGNVILENQGYLLKTNYLKYDYGQKKFMSNAPVTISRNDLNLSADSASFDLNSKKIIFKGNVKGTFGEGISL